MIRTPMMPVKSPPVRNEIFRFDSHVDNPHVDCPEEQKTRELRQSDSEKGAHSWSSHSRKKYREDLIDCATANPGLNAEPATCDKRPQQSGKIRACCPKRSATQNWKWDSILRPRMGVQNHGDQNNQVAEKNGKNGFRPIHATANKGRCKHVCR